MRGLVAAQAAPSTVATAQRRRARAPTRRPGGSRVKSDSTLALEPTGAHVLQRAQRWGCGNYGWCTCTPMVYKTTAQRAE